MRSLLASEQAKRAIERLGNACLDEPGSALRAALAEGEVTVEEVYHGLLRAVFERLLAEAARERGLAAPERFFCAAGLPWPSDRRPAVEGSAWLGEEPWRGENATDLGAVHEALLGWVPEIDATGVFRLSAAAGHERKRTGSYYTPEVLVEGLLGLTLDPLIEQVCAGKSDEEAAGALLDLRVCDPACGSGRLLVAAGRRLAARVARLRGGAPGAYAAALTQVVRRCLHGVDINPTAAQLSRGCLWLEAQAPSLSLAALEPQIQEGNSLLLPWPERFPEVFARGGFDCVLGNPPFIHSIGKGIDPRTKQASRRLHPEFRGTADLAYLLLGASLKLARAGGRVGMIQPRGVLNARSAERFRERPPAGFRPVQVWIPRRADLFPGASIFVCLLVFSSETSGRCAVCFDDDPHAGAWRSGELRSSNWWSEIQAMRREEGASAPRGGERLEARFLVRASMTAADAYDAVPFLLDRADGGGLRLVTTGLIEPGDCLWGRSRCRFLKRDYAHPRLDERPGLSASLARRAADARRPKILVAGLSRTLECFVDREGVFLGAVSTFSIFHPHDDVGALDALCTYLLSPEVTALFQDTLGANAMGGGNTTMNKDFLKSLPLPGGLRRAARRPPSGRSGSWLPSSSLLPRWTLHRLLHPACNCNTVAFVKNPADHE